MLEPQVAPPFPCEYNNSTQPCGDEMLTYMAEKQTAFTTVHGRIDVCVVHAPAWRAFAEREGYKMIEVSP
jgi:hypothetical protein